MKKISTLFKKNPDNLALVTNEVDPQNQWAIDGEGIATRKFDGTAAAIINGELYKRYDVKKGKTVPIGATPCQEPDEITGHWPHWVKCKLNEPADKYFIEAYINQGGSTIADGTYELCGPKIQGNPEILDKNTLVPHGKDICIGLERTWYGIQEYFSANYIEGIVFHHPDGRMCKIRKSDFGIKR